MKPNNIELTPDFIWKGLMPYSDNLNFQLELWQTVLSKSQANTPHGFIIGQEHPTVITLGKRGNPLLDVSSRDDSTPIVKIDRGGQATLHSPGQLVIYPILPLGLLEIPILKFVACLHKSTQKTLARFGVETEYPQNLGLFTKRGKIGFTGMRIEQGVSRHGIAINLYNDLSLFNKIRSCGVDNAILDRLKNHLEDVPTCEDFFTLWRQDFSVEFAEINKLNLK